MAVSAAGTAVSAYGQVQQGRAAKAEAYTQARLAEEDANAAGYAGIQQGQQAEREADKIKEQRDRVLHSQIAAVSKSGLTLSGSAVDVIRDTAIEAEKEVRMAKYRGDMDSYNSAQTARNYRNQASLYRMSGNNARRSAVWGATGTLLSGAANSFVSYKMAK